MRKDHIISYLTHQKKLKNQISMKINSRFPHLLYLQPCQVLYQHYS